MALEAANEAGRQVDTNRARRIEVEAQERNLVLVYVDKLAATDESAWKDFLPTMGAGTDVPRLFRTPGKVMEKGPCSLLLPLAQLLHLCMHGLPSKGCIVDSQCHQCAWLEIMLFMVHGKGHLTYACSPFCWGLAGRCATSR